MKKLGPEGIIATMVTPFTADEQLDEALLRQQIRRLLSSGVHGISACGSTGEGAAVTDAELVRITEVCKEEVPEGFPIVIGVIRNSTRAAVTAGLAVKQAGATVIMVAPVSYNYLVPDEQGNYTFYRTISEKVKLPIIIYNSVCLNEIKPTLFKRLCEIEYVTGIKQSLGGLASFYDMMMVCGGVGQIYSAVDDMLYSALDLGANGAIAAITSVYPKECVQIWDAVQVGDSDMAKKLQEELYPKWQVMKSQQFPRRLKEMLCQLGYDYGAALSPNNGISLDEKKSIIDVIKIE
jgi:4-hydroxy-tetrahydrodipicolinate synthase